MILSSYCPHFLKGSHRCSRKSTMGRIRKALFCILGYFSCSLILERPFSGWQFVWHWVCCVCLVLQSWGCMNKHSFDRNVHPTYAIELVCLPWVDPRQRASHIEFSNNWENWNYYHKLTCNIAPSLKWGAERVGDCQDRILTLKIHFVTIQKR